MRQAHRFSGKGRPYEGLTRLSGRGPVWTGRARFVFEKLYDPLRWRKPRMIFVSSMSDLFHPDISFNVIAAAFGVMAATPRHTFQILTKRPKRAREFFEWLGQMSGGTEHGQRLHVVHEALAVESDFHPRGNSGPLHVKHCAPPRGPWPLPNAWIGVSVEGQETANDRIPKLLDIPAAVKWLSYEPALGPVSFGLHGIAPADWGVGYRPIGSLIDWVVVGGESGPGARSFDIEWARATVRECKTAGVPVFVKQIGANPYDSGGVPGDRAPIQTRDPKGGLMLDWPKEIRVRQWPEVTP